MKPKLFRLLTKSCLNLEHLEQFITHNGISKKSKENFFIDKNGKSIDIGMKKNIIQALFQDISSSEKKFVKPSIDEENFSFDVILGNKRYPHEVKINLCGHAEIKALTSSALEWYKEFSNFLKQLDYKDYDFTLRMIPIIQLFTLSSDQPVAEAYFKIYEPLSLFIDGASHIKYLRYAKKVINKKKSADY